MSSASPAAPAAPPPVESELRGGPYLGEISALCLLPSSSSSSTHSPPLLLAGCGSSLLVYHLPSARLCASFPVFRGGVRLHGIRCHPYEPNYYELEDNNNDNALAVSLLCVFGETSLKLFRFSSAPPHPPHIHPLPHPPPFDHWVLTACFLPTDRLLALGLSDNSVALWHLPSSSLRARLRSPHSSLLYSMALHGHSLPSLRIASGTIYNQIIVWKIQPHDFAPLNLALLAAHHGSIFSLAWSHDTSKLISASDDRSARIWHLSNLTQNQSLLTNSQLALFGHQARIWDCYLSDSIIVTAGEDCTCRVWGVDGTQIMILKEHSGRGIWRCLYEPTLSLIITAGFDSAIKINDISSSLPKGKGGPGAATGDSTHLYDVFTISAPNTTKQHGFMDSKSEYVRCLHFTEENTLYVSTNNGFLYHVNISDPKFAKWTQLIQLNEKIAIICMDVTEMGVVALGDGKGNVTVVKVIDEGENEVKVDLSFTWSAEKERQLLGVFWCKSLGSSHLFTGDPRGMLKLWDIEDNFKINTLNFPRKVPLIAIFESCFGARIMCIDASPKEEILVTGDNKGNLTIFPFAGSFTMENASDNLQQKISFVDRFRGAHGIGSVTTVYVGESDSSNVEIRTVTIEPQHQHVWNSSNMCGFGLGTLVDKMKLMSHQNNKSSMPFDSLEAQGDKTSMVLVHNSISRPRLLYMYTGLTFVTINS